MSVQRAKNQDIQDGQKFFYTLSLVGPGLKDPKKQKNRDASPTKPKKYQSPEKAIRKKAFEQYKDGADPISDAINERAASGGTQYSAVINMSFNQTITKTYDLKLGKKYNLNSKKQSKQINELDQ